MAVILFACYVCVYCADGNHILGPGDPGVVSRVGREEGDKSFSGTGDATHSLWVSEDDGNDCERH